MARAQRAGLLVAVHALTAHAAPKTASPAMITPVPEPATVMKALDCVKSTVFSTDRLSETCRTLPDDGFGLNRRQHQIPYTCEWVGGITTKCLEGAHTLVDDVTPYNPQPFTVTDVVSITSSSSASTTTTTMTGTARISAAAPTAAGASWLFSLSETLMKDIFEISAEVCPAAKRRSQYKRDFGGTAVGLACSFEALDPVKQTTFTDRLADLLEKESVDITDLERFEEQLATAAGEDPEVMIDDAPDNLELAELEAEEAVEAMSVVTQQAGVSRAVLSAILSGIAGGGAGAAIYAGYEASNSQLVKALHDVKASSKVPLPPTSVEPSPTSTSKANRCAMCTKSGQCYLDPNDDQGEDGDPNQIPLLPPIITATPTSSSTSSTITTTAVTAPLTQGYFSPTTAVPTETASCRPESPNGQTSSWTVWKQPFLQKVVREFCSSLYDNPQIVNASNPFWLYKQFPGKYDSNPIYKDVGLYIHYEKQACPSSNSAQEVKLGGQGSLDCYAHFQWLWTDGCLAVNRKNPGDVGTERYMPQMGYYSDCMWWGITDSTEKDFDDRPPCVTATMTTYPPGFDDPKMPTSRWTTTPASTSWPMTCIPPATTDLCALAGAAGLIFGCKTSV